MREEERSEEGRKGRVKEEKKRGRWRERQREGEREEEGEEGGGGVLLRLLVYTKLSWEDG